MELFKTRTTSTSEISVFRYGSMWNKEKLNELSLLFVWNHLFLEMTNNSVAQGVAT